MTKVLVVGPAWIGDMVMAQALFKFYKQCQPTAVIDVLAPEATYPLLGRMPEINERIALPFKHGEFNISGRYRVAKSLRQKRYDHAIILANSWKSALIPFFAKIPLRTGWRGEMRWGLLNDVRLLHPQQLPLMVQRFIALGAGAKESAPTLELAKNLLPQLRVDTNNTAKLIKHFNLAINVGRILVLCPGAEYGSAKRWPIEHFAAIAKAKLAEGWQVWLMGGPKDSSITRAIQAATGSRSVDLAGKTSLLDAIDLLSLASVVVSNDSGLMHIGASLGRPLVVIYGSTDPRFTPPLSDQVKLLSLGLSCSPCFKRECPLEHLRCLTEITPAQVLAAVESLG